MINRRGLLTGLLATTSAGAIVASQKADAAMYHLGETVTIKWPTQPTRTYTVTEVLDNGLVILR